ncbi:hypothetical protein WDW86_17840 [Bdellovibrionota bacterium FG-2]
MITSKTFLKLPAFISLAILNCLIPFFYNWAATRYGLSVTVTGMASAIHEFITSMLSFYLLRAAFSGHIPGQDTKSRWTQSLQWSLLFVGVADLAYGITAYILRLPPPRGLVPLFHELPYAAFALLSGYAVVLRATDQLEAKSRKWVVLAIALIAGLYFVCSYELILLPFFKDPQRRPILIYTTAILYALGQAVMVGGILIASVRTLGFTEFLLWFFFTGVAASDFVLRYQDIGGPISGLSVFEYG